VRAGRAGAAWTVIAGRVARCPACPGIEGQPQQVRAKQMVLPTALATWHLVAAVGVGGLP